MRFRTRSQDRSLTGTVTRRKSRDIEIGPPQDWYREYYDEASPVVYPGTFRQETADGIHDWPPRGSDVRRDIGGVFTTEKKETQFAAPSIRSNWWDPTPGYFRYEGPLVASNTAWPGSTLGTVGTESELNAAGTTAIARSIPTSPPANVSVMLAELFREGVPRAVGASLLKSRFRDYREIGNEYLNVEFGWKPIVADLKSVSRAIVESERILQQLERDSGRTVRRKFAFPAVTKSSTSSGARSTLTAGHVLSGMVWDGESATYYDTFSQRRWFSGCYTYHFERPRGNSMAAAAQKARVLYGMDLTPEVVWNLTPWSWMADWVSNAGDVMTNVSRFSRDGLVMQYGYIMEHTVMNRLHTISNVSVSQEWGGPRRMYDCATEYLVETKVRQPATPFGFGLTEEGFDPRQWAILGALGISRGPSKL